MRNFTDDQGAQWTASAREEDTPRHHGRWYLVLHPEGAEEPFLPVPEIRWQTAASARRTLGTMSQFELRRRLAAAQIRADLPPTADATAQSRVNVNAG
jgi:hypothetical protein